MSNFIEIYSVVKYCWPQKRQKSVSQVADLLYISTCTLYIVIVYVVKNLCFSKQNSALKGVRGIELCWDERLIKRSASVRWFQTLAGRGSRG